MTDMLSRQEFSHAARTEAARVHGRKHAGFYNGLHFAPYWIVAALLGAAGWVVWWLYDTARRALDSGTEAVAVGPATASPGVPMWLWVALAVLVLLTAVAFRPGRISSFGVLVVKWLGLGALWLGLLGMMIAYAV